MKVCEKDKLYIVYTKRLATYLRECGHKIVKTGVNPHKPEFDIWYFEKDISLQQDINNYNSK